MAICPAIINCILSTWLPVKSERPCIEDRPVNVLDLGHELHFVDFVIYAKVEIFTRGGRPPIRCGE